MSAPPVSDVVSDEERHFEEWHSVRLADLKPGDLLISHAGSGCGAGMHLVGAGNGGGLYLRAVDVTVDAAKVCLPDGSLSGFKRPGA